MGRPGPNFEPFGFVLDLCWTIDEAFLAHLGTLLVLILGPKWFLILVRGVMMGPSWAHLGSIVVSRRQSMMGIYRPITEPIGSFLDSTGSLMGPSWTHLGALLVSRGSRRDPRWVKLAPSLGTLWDLKWIYLGLNPSGLMMFGPVLEPCCSLLGPKVDPWRAIPDPSGDPTGLKDYY